MCSNVRLRLSLRCGTHDGTIRVVWKSGDLGWFPRSQRFSCICDQQSLSQLAAADISCVHIWVGTRRVNNVHGAVVAGGAAASLSICHGSNNNALSLKACFNTCCRDRISATCIQRAGPVGPACSSELARITAEHLQHKSGTKIPPIWTFPLIQPLIATHPGYTLCPHLSLSWVILLFRNKTNPYLCAYSLRLSFLPGPSAASASWDLCLSSAQILCVHRGTMLGLEWDPAVGNLSACNCVYRYASLVCNQQS